MVNTYRYHGQHLEVSWSTHTGIMVKTYRYHGQDLQVSWSRPTGIMVKTYRYHGKFNEATVQATALFTDYLQHLLNV